MENTKTVLVTGAAGAIATHCIVQLLQRGFLVRGTLRSLTKKQQVLEMLQAGGITSTGNLSFIEADLTSDQNWMQAATGCDYVLHIASPTHITSQDEKDMVGPAVDGALRVLKAARDAGVKRVVMTSSFGAVGFSNGDRRTVTTEDNWTDPDQKGLSAYEKSKSLAERAAWDFVKNEGGNLQLSVINPVAVFGPVLGPVNSPSLGLIKALLNGSMKAVPNIALNVVDTRDVAALHILAMTTPDAAGQRFIASADGQISLPEIARLLKTKQPEISQKVSAKILPDWIVNIAALFNPQARQAASLMKINRNVSNQKAKKILGWAPSANQERAILAAAESMVKFGMIR